MPEMTPTPFDDLAAGDSRWPDPVTLADEAVSAELDGELDGLAVDLGVETAELRRRLHAWDSYAERKAALVRARDALVASPAPELGRLDRRRLVARALAGTEAQPRRSRPLGRRILAPAAAAVVLVALARAAVILASERTGDDSASDTALTELDSGSGAAEAEAALPALGEVSDPGVLRAALATEIDLPEEAETQARSDAATLDGSAEGSAPAADEGNPSALQEPATREQATACSDTLGEDLHATGAPLLVATATYDGAPAVVVVLDVADGTQVSVVSAADCSFLSSQFFVTGD